MEGRRERNLGKPVGSGYESGWSNQVSFNGWRGGEDLPLERTRSTKTLV